MEIPKVASLGAAIGEAHMASLLTGWVFETRLRVTHMVTWGFEKGAS